MVEIAKGYKTITRVDDGYSIVATPSTILVPTNYDGTNPVLTGAKARVLVTNVLGTSLTVTITSITPTGCTATYSGNELTITGISSDNANVLVYFSATGGYTGNINIPVLKAKQGESAYSVVLTNETHALPADYNGTVSPSAIDMAQSQIIVLKGATPLTPVASNATPTIGQFRYNISTVTGGTAVRVDNSTFKLSTITASTCKIKVTIYLESLSKSVEKEMVITKVVGADPDALDVFENWKYAGTTEIDGAKIRTGTITADKIVVETLIARYFRTNNVGARTTINVLPTDSEDPTGNTNYFIANAIRQYHESGRISMYEGIVKNLTIKVGSTNRTINGHAKVVFKDEVNSPILYVIDSSTANGIQYNNLDTVTYWEITGHRLLTTSLGADASDGDIIDLLFDHNGINYIPRPAYFCGFYKNAIYSLSMGLTASAGSIWKRISVIEGTSFVTANNGTTPITSGWYYRLGDFMEGSRKSYDDYQIVFDLSIQVHFIDSTGKISATKNLLIEDILWYQGGTGSNNCSSITPQIMIGERG